MSFKTQQPLFCKFTQQEIEERSEELVNLLAEFDRVEDAKKDRAKAAATQLKALRKKIRAAADAIRMKGEDRQVECVIRFHEPAAGTKVTVRCDTGEIVREAPMSEIEMQENLFQPGELEKMFGQGPQPPPASDAEPPAPEAP